MMNSYQIIKITFIIAVFSSILIAQGREDKGENDFIRGADISALQEIEDCGGIFTENGILKDPLMILKENGINFIRLRIWHTPANGYCGLEYTLITAERVKAAGLKLLLDFHYSDTWADPGNQTMPAAWENLDLADLKDSVNQYTRSVISILKQRNCLPDMIQVGNEISCGMLWDKGRICGEYDNTQQWANFFELISAAVDGVRDGLDPDEFVKIMIHIDKGGDNPGSRWFFDKLAGYDLDFDVIGLSYYPWWHGSLSLLENNLNDLALRYGKEIVVVETAYPWTLDWNDNTHNIVGEAGQLLAEYPATIEGQKNFLSALINIISDIPADKGAGLFYWAPEWISAPASGSPWENLALFDFSGEVLSSIRAFDSTLSEVMPLNTKLSLFVISQNYPNPFNNDTRIFFELPLDSKVTIRVFNALGELISKVKEGEFSPGRYEFNYRVLNLASGVYFYSIQAEGIDGMLYYAVKKMILLR